MFLFTGQKTGLYDQAFAIGFAGKEGHYAIQPYYVDREGYKKLDELQNFEVLNEKNIEEYYHVAVLGEASTMLKKQKEISDFSNELHEQLRTFGKLGADNKATVVSACLLALKAGLSPYDLKGEDVEGRENATMNVYTHIGFDDAEEELKRMEEFRKAQAEVEQKKEKPMSQKMFKVI